MHAGECAGLAIEQAGTSSPTVAMWGGGQADAARADQMPETVTGLVTAPGFSQPLAMMRGRAARAAS